MSKRSFAEYTLSKEIIRALNGLSYNHPTEVQGEVIPVALQRRIFVVPDWKWKNSFIWYSTL